jgi:hypothetical protein
MIISGPTVRKKVCSINQSVMMTTAAKRQNSRTGRRFTQSQTRLSRPRSVNDVRAMVVPTLLRPRPIRTGTEKLKGMEKTAFVCDDNQLSPIREMGRTKVDMFSTPTTTTTNGRM